MELGRQWKSRIEIWLEAMRGQCFQPLGRMKAEGFTTMNHLSYEEAMKRVFSPMPEGTAWGSKWEYGWFRMQLTVPETARGKRLVCYPDVGGEMLLWVNGRIAGSRDKKHDYITLTQKAEAGETFFLAAESYAGHGPRLENGGPYPMETIPVPEAASCQACVGAVLYGLWNETAYEAWLDAHTLYRLYEGLSPKSLRAAKVAEALKQFTLLADFELEEPARSESFRAASEVLKPLLSCQNGTTAPVMSIFGQSHLDLAWLWPWEETKRKCARTYSNQLALMEEYPEYRFLMCEPPIIENLKERYPEVYREVADKVAEGRMMPEGGIWVEPDTNLPCGESLVRQLTWGKRWYRSEWNVNSRMLWLPDTFGFSGNLPQLMKGCGIDYFTTQKLLRCDPECDPFPYNLFWWEGIDGSRVFSHIYKKNNSQIDPLLLIERWEQDRNQEEGMDGMLFPFGYGDGGGGADRDMLELVKRLPDLEGAPRCVMESPTDYLDRAREAGTDNRYQGELYLSWHRGVYTAQARLKRGCRKAEFALREAEFWLGLSAGEQNPGERTELWELWERLLFNQFHDILPGSSITRVNEEAEADFEHVIKGAEELARTGRQRLAGEEKSPGVWNSLSWERSACVMSEDGPVMVRVPACGVAPLIPVELSEKELSCCRQEGNGWILENNLLRVEITCEGAISSVWDKESQREFAAGSCNELKLYKDVNVAYDAWELGRMFELQPVELEREADISLWREKGCIAGLTIQRRISHSRLTQRVSLEAGSRRVEFDTEIDWKERHKILKAAFPVQVKAQESIEEIQYGYVKRPTHQNRQFDKDQYEVCCHKYAALADGNHGAAVLNDSKYGVDVHGSCISLTLLRAPVIPDMYADQGIQHFTYAFLPFNESFEESDVVRQGYELNVPLAVQKSTGVIRSFFSIDGHAILDWVKESFEEGNGGGRLILRLYEPFNLEETCVLMTQLPAAAVYEANLLEEQEKKLELTDGKVNLRFGPFEVKTVILEL